MVERLKFEGPADPIDLPPPPEEGQEPPPVDEEFERLKAPQFKLYDDFALRHKSHIDTLSTSLLTYRKQRKIAKNNAQQLWPLVITPEEEERRRREQEELEQQREEKARKEEEAKKAADVAAS